MLFLGPVPEPPATDDPDAGIVEATLRVLWILAATGVVAALLVAVLAATLLGLVTTVARLVRRARARQASSSRT